jgi:hypothetical protein
LGRVSSDNALALESHSVAKTRHAVDLRRQAPFALVGAASEIVLPGIVAAALRTALQPVGLEIASPEIVIALERIWPD